VTPLPAALGGSELVAWRVDIKAFAATWDSGEGAYQFGGRWNNAGIRAVYCSTDPATAILEVAVHKSFRALDTVPHILTEVKILDPSAVHVAQPTDIPNPNWLRPGIPSAGQQQFGNDLLSEHKFILIPSVVSTFSWNLVFVGDAARRAYSVKSQRRFALDTRLHLAGGT
jgi:RES domain-containing protein